MSSTWGSNLKISIFGESHSKAIGIVIDGIPAGTVIDREQLLAFLARRSSRGGKLDTPRIEADQPQLLSGMLPDPQDPNLLVACGTPVCAMIENANTQSKDYDQLRSVARPGHADFTGFMALPRLQRHPWRRTFFRSSDRSAVLCRCDCQTVPASVRHRGRCAHPLDWLGGG